MIFDDVNCVIRYGLHEYFILHKKEDLNDYEDPLEFSKKHINGIRLMLDRIFGRLVNEVTRILVGEVKHFYPKIGVSMIDLSNELKIGDQILIESKNTSLRQETLSMEIEHMKVEKCEKGPAAIKVNERVRAGDKIYKIKKIDNSTFLSYI
jgi:hypothetical protein